MPRGRSTQPRTPGAGESAGPLRAALLRWFDRNRRDLPWRRTRDPYAIWVSEIMLQQTQVDTALPYYRRFLQRFPDVTRLAAASEEEVLSVWSGLGYYRRARMLREAARAVVEHYGGRLPREVAALKRLPGIGRYTAGAICSMAFDLCEPVLDGNVRRVLSRLFAVDGSVVGRAAEERKLWSIASVLVRGARPGDLNQALMEFGALVCRPRDADCRRCPLRRRCRALALGAVERLPAARPAPPSVTVRVGVAVIRRGGRLLLERPGESNPLRGSWDLPAVELTDGVSLERTLARGLARRHGLSLGRGRAAGRVVHGIMQRRLSLEIQLCGLRRGKVAGRETLRWLDPAALNDAAVSGATRKILRHLGDRSIFQEDQVKNPDPICG